MRKYLIGLSILLLVSCSKTKTFDSTINFEKQTVERDSRDIVSDTTYSVSIVYNNPVDAPNYLKDSILKHTNILLSSWFKMSEKGNLSTSVKNHMDEYFERVKNNNFQTYYGFNLKIKPNDPYQNKEIVSLAYNWILYEGGARGHHGKYCFTINKKTGAKLKQSDLIKADKEIEFLKIAEDEFKKQSGIKEGEQMPEIYKFKNNKFHLNNNFIFTTSGLVFYYNPFEIAPFAMGTIELSLSYEIIGKFLSVND